MPSTICLNMIVKDEAHVIGKTLANILDKTRIDYWVICDTGSSDDTIKIIEDFFGEAEIEGEIHRHEWKDFAHNRNLALDAAKGKGDYLLIFDADDEIHGDFDIPEDLTLDMYHVFFGGGFSYRRGSIINNKKRWRWKGVLHEVIMPDEKTGPPGDIDGDYYFVSGRTGNRSKNPNKYLDDARILSEAFENPEEPWLKPRYAFYCAQSFKDAGLLDDAIKWYKVTLGQECWSQEKFYSALMIGQMSLGMGKDAEGIYYCLETVRYDNSRWEGIYHAINHLLKKDQKDLAVIMMSGLDIRNPIDPRADGKLFIDEAIHDFRLLMDISIHCCKDGNIDQGRKAIHNLYKNIERLPPVVMSNTMFNSQFYTSSNTTVMMDHFERTLTFFNEALKKRNTHACDADTRETLDKLLQRLRVSVGDCGPKSVRLRGDTNCDVIVTMTTCKRLSLFRKTMDSIIRCWNDLSQVDRFVVVDDGSSEPDLEMMTQEYPWLEIVRKTSDRGHRGSMNKIRDIVLESGAKYWMHIEDDWEFIVRRSYVGECRSFLDRYSDDGIKQVLLNKCYAETIHDIAWTGGEPLPDGFLKHIINDGPCGYWPHFSFRPCMVMASVLQDLGDFNSPNTFFEMDYANKYTAQGYKSAYFDAINCLHIGKLAGQRGDKQDKNAYELNEQVQGIGRRDSSVMKQAIMINLDRRPDRLNSFASRCPMDFYRLPAVDGEKLPALTKKERGLMARLEGKQHVRGESGCSLSHYRAWKAAAAFNGVTVIMEDDIEFGKEAEQGLQNLVFPPDLDLLYIGGMWVPDYGPEVDTAIKEHRLEKSVFNSAYDETPAAKIFRRAVSHSSETHIFNTPFWRCAGGYAITMKGANTLISMAHDSPDFIRSPLDMWLVKTLEDGKINGGDRFPHLVSQVWDPDTGNIRRDKRVVFSRTEIPTSLKLIGPDNWWESEDTNLKYMNHNTIPSTDKDASRNTMANHFGVMCEEDRRWGNFILTEEREADYYIMINSPSSQDYFDKEKTIIFRMEPYMEKNHEWGPYANPGRELGFMHVHSANQHLNVGQTQFRIPETIDLTNKKAIVSSIQSGSLTREGHRLRVEFLRQASNEMSEMFHLFGRENYHDLSIYQGPIENKAKAFTEYKYYFMAESESYNNYATEKIWEPILCESLCFYWGCPNLGDYIPEKAFVRLDLHDIEGSLQIVRRAISENWWEERLPYIREAKGLFYSKYGFFPVINSIVNESNKSLVSQDGRIGMTIDYIPHETTVFYAGYDIHGHDIDRLDKSNENLKILCATQYADRCVAFNTLGFIKSSLGDSIKPSQWFGQNDGVWIKKKTPTNDGEDRKPMVIITPSYRVQNLKKIEESIDFDHVLRWIIVYDGKHIKDNPKLFEDNEKIDEYIYEGESCWGNGQRNYGLDKASEIDGQFFLYFLDDDNIMHPDFDKILPKLEYGNIYTFDQVRSGEGGRTICGNEIRYQGIDTAQFIADFELVKEKRWRTDVYQADFFYIQDCCVSNYKVHQYIPLVGCYWNYLPR